MRIRRNPASALGSQRLQLRNQRALFIEQVFWSIAAQPTLDEFEALLVRNRIEDWHLVSAPEIFDLMSIHFFRTGPSLG